MKLPDDPSPVPAGISAMLVISSRRSSHSSMRSDSRIKRMPDVLDPLDFLHLRILEERAWYEPRMRDVYTYLSIAADTTNPLCSW